MGRVEYGVLESSRFIAEERSALSMRVSWWFLGDGHQPHIHGPHDLVRSSARWARGDLRDFLRPTVGPGNRQKVTSLGITGGT